MTYTKEEKKQFETYLRRFNTSFRVRRNEYGIYEVLCKDGYIDPYSLTELCCYSHHPNRLGISRLKERMPSYCVIIQESATGLVFKFPNKHFEEIATLMGAKKRRHLSEEHKKKIMNNLKPYRIVCRNITSGS
jgi:hypothetical protein